VFNRLLAYRDKKVVGVLCVFDAHFRPWMPELNMKMFSHWFGRERSHSRYDGEERVRLDGRQLTEITHLVGKSASAGARLGHFHPQRRQSLTTAAAPNSMSGCGPAAGQATQVHALQLPRFLNRRSVRTGCRPPEIGTAAWRCAR
jgi:hypothetical protein